MCPRKTTAGNGYCADHQHLSAAWQKPRQKGSGRGGRPWRRKRERILQRDNYLCQPCMRAGRVQPASEVDHIVGLAAGGTDDDSNLEAICRACHKVKTAQEAQTGRQ